MCNLARYGVQVLERANKNEYGLAAGVWAKGGWHSRAPLTVMCHHWSTWYDG